MELDFVTYTWICEGLKVSKGTVAFFVAASSSLEDASDIDSA